MRRMHLRRAPATVTRSQAGPVPNLTRVGNCGSMPGQLYAHRIHLPLVLPVVPHSSPESSLFPVNASMKGKGVHLLEIQIQGVARPVPEGVSIFATARL